MRSVAGSGTYSLTPEQAQNASIIAAVAIRLGLPDHAASIALATSLQESGLRNLPSGDRDSVGLFQQRPSEGWGTRTQILDPVYAATAFYTQLQKTPGWQTMAVTDAAQAVQRSASPDAYAQWETEARSLAVALTGEASAAMSCRLTSFAGAAPAAGALQTAATTELGGPIEGTFAAKPGWEVAGWLVGHAWEYHIARITFGGATWTASAGAWRGNPAASGGAVSFVLAP